ncbi:hypothetical protein A1O1_09230 [Capronia coronata CBS 617.96]|uniref:Zn(2)-C6 fungal-type domain-containing protein n=1 Tax=Capronia coronata CBS 617.96 TaxID=1182541 RepID=W9XF53_9EURO|nr:uncharacterized protein A1O1_09230 [Capronia coronata CBS 617.96]EXJ78828.1 hypothetical protein A1O1_09230 [Capronia coronata CBS 617.96]
MSFRRFVEPGWPPQADRPFRSHLHPACLSCRRRKLRCRVDRGSEECAVCQARGEKCIFPDRPKGGAGGATSRRIPPPRPHRVEPQAEPMGQIRNEGQALQANPNTSTPVTTKSRVDVTWTPTRQGTGATAPEKVYDHEQRSTTTVLHTITVDNETDEEISHVVGPAVARDAKILGDWVSNPSETFNKQTRSSFPNGLGTNNTRNSGLFTTVRMQPLGLRRDRMQDWRKCQFIEKLTEPCAGDLVEIYLEKSNVCFPMLDDISFRQLYSEKKEDLSPVLLSCLYANATAYWGKSNKLRLDSLRCPDIPFIWSQALESLFNALLFSPELSTVIAVLLNIGGRPTTTTTSNSIALGGAVALSQSLGLNRDCSTWEIADSEKSARVRIWWGILIHDRWSSLAYGTPYHVQNCHHDVPVPSITDIVGQVSDGLKQEAGFIFIALCNLTESVLAPCLELIYSMPSRSQASEPRERQLKHLELRLDQWEQGLSDGLRKLVVRGTQLKVPGAANLRLCYLSITMLFRRMELNFASQGQLELDLDASIHRNLRAQKSAEEIVHFVQDLGEDELNDFWLSEASFLLAYAATLLLGCALDSPDKSSGLSNHPAVRRTHNLVTALRSHKEIYGWELGDLCLAQCGEIVDKLSTPEEIDIEDFTQELQQTLMNESLAVDELFPSVWDMFNGT